MRQHLTEYILNIFYFIHSKFQKINIFVKKLTNYVIEARLEVI